MGKILSENRLLTVDPTRMAMTYFFLIRFLLQLLVASESPGVLGSSGRSFIFPPL